MDAIFPLKSKKSIKAFNQAVSHNNAIMRLQIQNALYKQELNRVKAANDLANATLALARQQSHEAHEARVSTAAAAAALAQQQSREAHEARFSAAAALAQQQAREAHEARVSTAAALAQRQAHEAHEARFSAAAALAQQQARQAAVAAANTNKQELIARRNNKKSSKFGKLLSKMNKQH